jgi:SHS2 domain-containing protein
MTRKARAGHRSLPHTADSRLEAWARTREQCFAEVVRALAESFVDPPAAPHTSALPVDLPPGSDEDLLLGLLEEAVFAVDVLGLVPLTARVSRRDDGGLSGWFDAVALVDVTPTGSGPKAVTRHRLSIGRHDDGTWHCLVTVDV